MYSVAIVNHVFSLFDPSSPSSYVFGLLGTCSVPKYILYCDDIDK